MNENVTVNFNSLEIKMIETTLNHQWHNMTDDNGKAINCKQESADCVYELLKEFKKLRKMYSI
jgi:hypothetical protein